MMRVRGGDIDATAGVLVERDDTSAATTEAGIENEGIAGTTMIMTVIGNAITAVTDIDPERGTTTGDDRPPGLAADMAGKKRTATGNAGQTAVTHRLNADGIPSVTEAAMTMNIDIEIRWGRLPSSEVLMWTNTFQKKRYRRRRLFLYAMI